MQKTVSNGDSRHESAAPSPSPFGIFRSRFVSRHCGIFVGHQCGRRVAGWSGMRKSGSGFSQTIPRQQKLMEQDVIRRNRILFQGRSPSMQRASCKSDNL
jgi:hypothetical protein